MGEAADRLPSMVLTAGFWLVALFLLCFVTRAVRLSARRVQAWLTFYRSRTYRPGTERLFHFLGFDLHSQRVYSTDEPADARRILTGVTVVPGIGVGPIRFGMTPFQVETALGRSLGSETWDDGNVNDSLIYDGVRFIFDRCDHRGPLTSSRLCGIEVCRADAVLFGRPLGSWDRPALEAVLTAMSCSQRVSEPGYAEYESPRLRMWFEAGRGVKIEIAE